MDFLSGVGAGAMRTRLESPRVCYATPGLPIGPTRASRRRQLPTNQCHAALPSPVIRAYQPDSSSKPSHRHPRADALGKPSASSRDFRGCQCRSRDRPRPNNRLTAGPSISADDGGRRVAGVGHSAIVAERPVHPAAGRRRPSGATRSHEAAHPRLRRARPGCPVDGSRFRIPATSYHAIALARSTIR